MKTIVQRFWREPAVAIGLVWTLGLLILTIATDSFDASSIAGIVSPLISALGIRQLVTPAQRSGE